jgi:DNA-binding NarL/FixJ family response regulator
MIKIIIYDDNEQRRKSLEALISLNDDLHFAAGFADCSNVINDVELHLPDVVLMDIAMPNVDGIEGVKLIKQHMPSVRIIMQTVFEDNEKIFAALKAGAEGYILKNTSAEKIIQSIQEVYKGGAFMTPSVAMQVMKYFSTVDKPIQEYNLTQKEKQVLTLLSDGKSYKMVADNLSISYFTVNSHIKKIYEKLHVHSLGEAVSMALRNNIV